jgi:hypothetical protein
MHKIEINNISPLSLLIGAVYRYYESRRRVFNDSKPGRASTVEKNNKQRRTKQAQKQVTLFQNLYYGLVCSISFHSFAFSPDMHSSTKEDQNMCE